MEVFSFCTLLVFTLGIGGVDTGVGSFCTFLVLIFPLLPIFTSRIFSNLLIGSWGNSIVPLWAPYETSFWPYFFLFHLSLRDNWILGIEAGLGSLDWEDPSFLDLVGSSRIFSSGTFFFWIFLLLRIFISWALFNLLTTFGDNSIVSSGELFESSPFLELFLCCLLLCGNWVLGTRAGLGFWDWEVLFLLDVVGSSIITDLPSSNPSTGWDELDVTTASSFPNFFNFLFFYLVFLLDPSLHAFVSCSSIDLETPSWENFCWRSCFQILPCFLNAWTTNNFINPWWWILFSGFLDDDLTPLTILFRLIQRKWGNSIRGPPSKCDKSFKWYKKVTSYLPSQVRNLCRLMRIV